MSLVLDSSLTLAWLFADESTEATEILLDRVIATGAVVPSLWKLEVANGLQIGVKRQRISVAWRDLRLADLRGLPIEIDLETDAQAWSSTLRAAERHKLTLYDAAYFELAQRRGLPLASLDRDLRAAAEAAGVEVL